MNRKIFTLLASALMLFSTAFVANARVVSDKSVGAEVKSLRLQSDGTTTVGMYHIRVDSICVVYSSVVPSGATAGQYDWIPVGSVGTTRLGCTAGYINGAITTTDPTPTVIDTMVLAVTEAGKVIPVDMKDLLDHMAIDGATLKDYQATMWCVALEDNEEVGNWPTFHFQSKVYGTELDFAEGSTVVDTDNKGWMYSPSYLNGQLKSRMPFFRTISSENYSVVTQGTDGFLYNQKTPISSFVADQVEGELKFTLVGVSPIVLTADEFNSKLGQTDKNGGAQLYFDPNPSGTKYSNYFGDSLIAKPSENGVAEALGYLNVKSVSAGYIYNSHIDGQYTNDLGTEYLQIKAGLAPKANDKDKYNSSYRFVYFPSEDSLVINAYYVKHNGHAEFANASYEDNGVYNSDAAGVIPYYYGLYNDEIHKALIVRLQDLNGVVNGSLMTIGKHPANVRIYFKNSGCEALYENVVNVSPGIYTIWDTRGRCLAVRIYNGTLAPQWVELEDGECPDRIPAYQWVVEKSSKGNKYRINISNREFGYGQPPIRFENVLVRYTSDSSVGGYKIFGGTAGDFMYGPLASAYQALGDVEPVTEGKVNGVLLAANDGVTACTITSETGFKPVANPYVTDQYLGYKHFVVNSDPTSVSYGKSEDAGTAKGMDYNAFAFNYLHSYDTSKYIGLEPKYQDTLLHIEAAEGFQFMLGSTLRSQNNYKEEAFGYPDTEFGGNTIEFKYPEGITAPNANTYTQSKAPALKRYYYELKVADFYSYRDGLAEQYVVLKGFKNDGSDSRNALKYGVADVYADGIDRPLKFANIYLRETYFLPKPKLENEERKQDDTRRIYYTLMDRIEMQQVETVTGLGLEVSDTLSSPDGSTKYNLVTVAVDDANAFLKAQGKTVSTVRPSTFALINMNYPLYRRLNSKATDGANEEGKFVYNVNGDKMSLGEGTNDASANTYLDAPKTLRFYTQRNPSEFLYEDAISQDSYVYGINYLGLANEYTYPEKVALDGTVKYNYNLFVDTAYINRGTGPIKPQYLIAVAPQVVEAKTIQYVDKCGNKSTGTLEPYIRARYLINASDSARGYGSDGSNTSPIRDKRYMSPVNTTWERLVFVDAIHANDTLYIVSRLDSMGITESSYTVTDEVTGEEFVNISALSRLVAAKDERKPSNSNMYGAYYVFENWKDYHNDVSFSLRFINDDAQNASVLTGTGDSDNNSKAFLIESETTNRTPYGNKKIAPVQGGWVKLNNGIPVMSRTSYEDAINQAEIFNVAEPTDWQNGYATSNGTVAKVSVIGGTGEVTILNASGKNVTISNMLGQTIASSALTSDKATVKVSKGIVVVAIEGEAAVKTIVK